MFQLIFDELKESMRDQRNFNYEFDRLNKRLVVAEKYMSSLQKKLDGIDAEVEKLYEQILELDKNYDDPCSIMN